MARPGRYIIETRTKGSEWSIGGLGEYSAADAPFTNLRDARAAVASLRALGDEWRTAEYRIRDLECEARYIPLNA